MARRRMLRSTLLMDDGIADAHFRDQLMNRFSLFQIFCIAKGAPDMFWIYFQLLGEHFD